MRKIIILLLVFISQQSLGCYSTLSASNDSDLGDKAYNYLNNFNYTELNTLLTYIKQDSNTARVNAIAIQADLLLKRNESNHTQELASIAATGFCRLAELNTQDDYCEYAKAFLGLNRMKKDGSNPEKFIDLLTRQYA